MTTVNWQLKLGVDGIGEVRKATKELNAVKAAATDMEKGLNSFKPTALGAAPKQLGLFSRALQGIGGGVSKLFGAKAGGAAVRGVLDMAQGLEKIQPLLPAVGAVAGAAVGVFAAASGAALAGARAVIQAQAFREDSFGALKTLLRSNELADQAFKTAVKTADFLGRGRQETVGQFVDLLAKGFDIKKVDEIVKAMADLATVDPKANMDAIVRAIGQIKGTGRLQGDELLQLADAGLETSAVYEQLAKILKKSVPDVQKLISAGKVDADTAIQAILAAINTQAGGGAAGAAAARKSIESISGLLRRLENLPENLLFSLDVAPGMERVRGFLKELVGFFDMNSESGKELTAVLGDLFNEFIAGLLGEDPAANVRDSFKSLIAALKELNANGTTRQFGEMLGTTLKLSLAIAALSAHIGDVNSAFSASTGATGALLGDLGQFVTLAGLLSPGIDALNSLASIDLTGLARSFGEFVNGLPDMAASLVQSAAQLGSDIVAGIAAGISGGVDAVLNAMAQVVGGAIAWAEKILGISSPSKVFAEIGNFTAEGFAVGVAKNDNAQGALADMAAAPDGGAPALRIGGGGSAPLIGGDLNITVTGGGDEKFARLVAVEVQRTLESLAIQMGAVQREAA